MNSGHIITTPTPTPTPAAATTFTVWIAMGLAVIAIAIGIAALVSGTKGDKGKETGTTGTTGTDGKDAPSVEQLLGGTVSWTKIGNVVTCEWTSLSITGTHSVKIPQSYWPSTLVNRVIMGTSDWHTMRMAVSEQGFMTISDLKASANEPVTTSGSTSWIIV